MSAEKTMRKRVVRALQALDAVSIENGCGVGTPDINFIDGWMELKSVDCWPAHADTPVKIDHYTPEQQIWLNRRAKMGGRTYLLVKVGADWLLYRGSRNSIFLVGNACRADMLNWACAKWMGGLDDKELLYFLQDDAAAFYNS